jgi:hypothetical protein
VFVSWPFLPIEEAQIALFIESIIRPLCLFPRVPSGAREAEIHVAAMSGTKNIAMAVIAME